MSDSYIIPSLGKGLDIIDYIVSHQGTGFNEIKEVMQINVATLSRVLNQLQDSGYIYKCPNRRYYAGYKLATMDVCNSVFKLLIQYTETPLAKISKDFHVTIMLVGFLSDKMVVLKKHLNENNLGMMHEGAILRDYQHYFWGTFYLMGQEKEKRNKLNEYSKKNPDYPVRPDSIMVDDYFIQANKNGFITDYGRILPNATRLAVPIFTSKKIPIGAIAIGSFTNLLEGVDSKLLVSETIKVADFTRINLLG